MRYLLYVLLSIPIISFSQADQLRAVIIVGDLQGGTVSAIKEMEEIHSFCQEILFFKITYHSENPINFLSLY
jgi:hypothetical protein